MSQTIAIYHKDCIDGTAAAALFLRKFPEALLFPLSHSYKPTDLEAVFAQIDSGSAVYLIDCTIGIQEFLARGLPVTIIDHHVSERDAMESLARENTNLTYIFDNSKSAAVLAWQHFFPDEEMPQILAYVQDNDIWTGKYGKDTIIATSYLSMFRNDPQAMLGLIEGDLREIMSKGEVVMRYADQEIARQIEWPALMLKIDEYLVPAYNITVYTSACGAILSERTGKAVLMFTIKGDSVKLSFRSQEGQSPSALDLAALLGGGGHEYASGAPVTLKQFLEMIVS